jgi:hypothetical protein
MGVLEASYYELEQQHTLINLKDKIKIAGHDIPDNDIIVEFDASKLTKESFNIIAHLSEIIAESGEPGVFELDIFQIGIEYLETYEHELIHIYNK